MFHFICLIDSFLEKICVDFFMHFSQKFLLITLTIQHLVNARRLVIFLCKTDRNPSPYNFKEHRLIIHSIRIEYRHIYDALTTAVKTFSQFLLPFLTYKDFLYVNKKGW